MRRIIRNSTALVTALAVIAPQAGLAEMRITAEQAAQMGPVRAERNPGLASMLQAELDAGLTEDQLTCADGSPRPCADDVFLMTPKGVTVVLAEDGQMIIAPREDQVNASVAAAADATAAPGQPAVAAEQAPPAETAAPSTAETAPAAEPAPAPPARQNRLTDLAAGLQQKADEEAAAAARVQAEAAAQAPVVAAEPAPPAKPAAQTTAEAAPEPAPAPRPRQNKLTDLAAGLQQKADADAAAKAAAGAEVAATPAPAPAPAPAAAGALILSDSETARDRAQRQAVMSQRLQAEVAAGLTMDQLVCETGRPQPCQDGLALLTPGGVTVEADGTGRIMLAERDRQQNRVTDSGEVQARAPEEDVKETTAAQEAAAEVSAPTAAALDENAQASAQPVVEQPVTQANTRNSAQDFESSLRDALAGSGVQARDQQAAAAAKDDGNNDLAKALILGLGAVAVGQMLNNNRQVALSTPDRVVVTREDGSQEVIKDEVVLLRQPGSTVTTENFDDGSSRTIVTREDGSRVVTIRDANLRVLRRTLISADGKTTQLIDDTAQVEPVVVSELPPPAPVVATNGPLDEAALRAALQTEAQVNRTFTLSQIRNIPEVRALVAPVNIDAITFDTGSAAIKPDQAQQLATLGRVIQEAIARNPHEIFMIEGHTDTVGSDAMNLALSDRRAESVALALTEYFDVPPENLVVQGYGEQFLKVRAEGDIRENRRASVRRITDLLRTASN